MKTLWSPWRMEHVNDEAGQPVGCIFEPPGQEPYSKNHLLLYRGRHCVVIMNRFPYANGHLLAAPVRHVGDITDLDAKENLGLMILLQKCCGILRKHLQPDGLNIGLNLGKTAGAGIADHLHFHIVPRWEGDHNFMTVTAEIRTIPQHINATYDMLLPDFQKLHLQGDTSE